MKAYKGFNKDMTCRGFQYEEGKEYETGKAKLCKEGFHACEAPLDCFNYYAPGQSVYREVEIDDVSDERKDDSKLVGKKIKIGAKIDVAGICKAHFEYVKAHVNFENTDKKQATAGNRGAATAGEYGAATAGEYGAATAGEYGAATAGYCGAATAGYCGAATAGYRGAATAGYCGAATAGYCGAATAGDRGAATAGYCGAATAGDRGAATAKGSVSVGKNGCALCRAQAPKAKGGIGSVLTLCREHEDGSIAVVKTISIDGEKYLPDTWYTIKNRTIALAKEDAI